MAVGSWMQRGADLFLQSDRHRLSAVVPTDRSDLSTGLTILR